MPRPFPGRSSWARRCAGLVLVLVLPLTALGCRSAADTSAMPAAGGGDARATLASHPVPTRTRIHRVFGRLPEPRRKAVRRQVGHVVDRWWEAAYLGGTYPRSITAALPGFTAGAQERARSDRALLTNQAVGARIDSVTPQHRELSLDILATDRQARSVTAHVVLRFATTGQRTGTTVVRGRLFLTQRRGAWRIFGYDLAKGAGR